MTIVRALISKSDNQVIRLAAQTVANVLREQTVAITASKALLVLPDYVKAEQSIAQIAQALNGDWHTRLTSVACVARTQIQDGDAWRRIIELHQPFEAFREIDKLNAGIRAAVNALSFANSLCRQDIFIRLYTESLRLTDLTRLSVAIRNEAVHLHGLFLPTLDAFSVLRGALLQRNDYWGGVQVSAREHFLTTDLLHALTATEQIESFETERAVVLKDTDEQMLLTLSDAISFLNPELYRLWSGAWKAFRSDNPDRVRHTLVSTRELVTHLLHALSPDDQVRAWSKSNEHYSNGRPTRRARLLFIFRDISDPFMKDHCQKEVAACLSLIDLFHTGTHNIIPAFSDAQLRVILRRVHSMICALVEIHRAKF